MDRLKTALAERPYRRPLPPPLSGWTIVTEFDGSADSVTRDVVRNYIQTALDGSPVITTLPDEGIEPYCAAHRYLIRAALRSNAREEYERVDV